MATTTNYGWTTPDDTALVKDGAAAIRTLGTSIDTTTKNLNPSTTLGDIEYRSSTANTNTRLAIGSTGQVLTVASGVPSWATPAGGGGMTLLSTTTLSGSSTTISTISQSYTDLQLIIKNIDPSAAMILRVNPNGATDKITYSGIEKLGTGNPQFVAGSATDTQFELNYNYAFASANTNNVILLRFYDYASTASYKPIVATVHMFNSNSSQTTGTYTATYRANTEITSLVISCTSGSFNGGTALLYGVK